MLRELIKTKKFPSPLIIEGEKRSALIQEFANYALCETQTACGQCRSCKQILKGFHPDWITLKGAVKIEEVRESLLRLRQRPFQSSVRVFSYDDAQEANVFVQNALLKTFEEPLPHWILLLGVNSKMSLLLTIRSRCLFYREPDVNGVDLSDEEEKIFKLISETDELGVQKELEPILKDRQKTKQLFQKLLLQSTKRGYPGHWSNLSPYLDECLPELTRNLNPRLVWDRAWAKSFALSL